MSSRSPSTISPALPSPKLSRAREPSRARSHSRTRGGRTSAGNSLAGSTRSVPCRRDRKLGDGNQVDTFRLGAVDAKEVDLALIVTLDVFGFRVMGVVAANAPADSSVAEPACLALNLRERRSVVDDEVVACVFAERHEDPEPRSRSASMTASVVRSPMSFGCSMPSTLPDGSAGPWPKQTTEASPTMRERRSSSAGRASAL